MLDPAGSVIRGLQTFVSVPVRTLVPTKRPQLFVRVDAGVPVALSPVSDRTMVMVQVYGAEFEAVLGLLDSIRFYLRDRISLDVPEVSGWDEESGPHDFPDPDIPDVFRWQIAGLLFTTLT